MFIGVSAARDLSVTEFFFRMTANGLKQGHPIDSVNRQTEAVGLVVDGEFHGCIDVPLFLVTSDMQVLVIGTPIGQAVNQPRVSMEIENDRLVCGEQQFTSGGR